MLKEVAKFLCGFETFHAILHLYLACTGSVLTIFGFSLTTPINSVSAVINTAVAIFLAIYAWKPITARVESK